MMDNQLIAKEGGKANRRQSAGSLKDECEELAHYWIMWGNDINMATSGLLFNELTRLVEKD